MYITQKSTTLEYTLHLDTDTDVELGTADLTKLRDLINVALEGEWAAPQPADAANQDFFDSFKRLAPMTHGLDTTLDQEG